MRRPTWWVRHLERRSEIGLRRAVGATKGNMRTQFPAEAILLATVGVGPGAAATVIYAAAKGWAIVMSAQAWGADLAAALLIGAIAGLLPAIKAAWISPT